MFYRLSERIPKMLRALVIFLLIIGFVAEARFHGVNPYQRLLSKCVIYLLNKHVQQLLRGERRGGWGGVLALVNQGVPRACFRGEKKKRKFCGFHLADYWHRERIIQFNSNGTTLSKHEALDPAKTNGRNVLFQLLLLSNVHFFRVASVIFICLWVSFIIVIRSFSSSPWGSFFKLVPDEKNKTT